MLRNKRSPRRICESEKLYYCVNRYEKNRIKEYDLLDAIENHKACDNKPSSVTIEEGNVKSLNRLINGFKKQYSSEYEKGTLYEYELDIFTLDENDEPDECIETYLSDFKVENLPESYIFQLMLRDRKISNVYDRYDLETDLDILYNTLLNFTVLSSKSESIEIKEKTFKIKGMDQFADDIIKCDINGVIEHENKFYFKDNLNLDLVDDIYVLEDTEFTSSSRVLDSDQRQFLASLRVNNDDIFVQKYKQARLKYGHAAGRAPSKGGQSIKVGVVIGELPCLKNVNKEIVNYNNDDKWKIIHYNQNNKFTPIQDSIINKLKSIDLLT